jgi:hypothetical protein
MRDLSTADPASSVVVPFLPKTDMEVERLRDAGAPTSPASGSLRMTSPHGAAAAGTGEPRAESGTSGSSLMQHDLQYEGPEIDSVEGGLRRKLRLQSGDLVRAAAVCSCVYYRWCGWVGRWDQLACCDSALQCKWGSVACFSCFCGQLGGFFVVVEHGQILVVSGLGSAHRMVACCSQVQAALACCCSF